MDRHQPYLVALGANLPSRAGPPAHTLRAALDALDAAGTRVEAVSRFYATPCFPAGAGPDYVNAAARLGSARPPADFLDLLHRVEGMYGRERQERWGRRTLDLDLIAAGDAVLPDAATQDAWRDLPEAERPRRAPERLILPHPRLQERAFVLVPLADVAADWQHPRLGLTVAQMLAALPRDARDAAEPV
nr:2-amino-4-hydroxy-6-hydroxymethyldihydropteridine diphosphokinase [Roseovarius salinarum]